MRHEFLLRYRGAAEVRLSQRAHIGFRRVIPALCVALLIMLASRSVSAHLIHDAVEKGDIEEARALLEKVPERANERDNEMTPLFIACDLGDLEMARLLLSYGADVNYRSSRGHTPVRRAAASGNKELVECLLSKGGQMTFNAAVLLNDIPKAREFLRDDPSLLETTDRFEFAPRDKANVRMAATAPNAVNALHSAVCHGYREMVIMLIEQGADVNKTGWGSTPLSLAVRKGDLDLAELLISRDADVNAQFFVPTEQWEKLMSRIAAGKGPFSMTLGRVDPNWESETVLCVAVMDGKLDMVKLLIAKGADANLGPSPFINPLRLAYIMDRNDIVDVLLKNGAKETFFDICFIGDLERAKKMIDDNKSLVNEEDEKKLAPIHHAAAGGHADMVQLLIDSGADPTKLALRYNTAMSFASERGHEEVVATLIENGVDVNRPTMLRSDIEAEDQAKPRGSLSPVLLAAQHEHTGTVKLLVKAGADPNIIGARGGPLMEAVRTGNRDLVEFLLEKGVMASERSGPVNLKIATDLGYDEIGADLVRHFDDEDIDKIRFSDCVSSAAAKGMCKTLSALVQKLEPEQLYASGMERAISVAVTHRQRDALEIVLKALPSTQLRRSEYEEPFRIAAIVGDIYIMKTLIEHRRCSRLSSFLPYAAGDDNIEMIEFLIEEGADITGSEGTEALCRVARRGSTTILKYLLAEGATINVDARRADNPLNGAIESGNLDTVKLLLEKGVPIDYGVDKNGNSVMHYAALGGPQVFFYLLDKGCRTDLRNKKGETPFISAASAGHTKVVEYFLHEDPGPNAADLTAAFSLAVNSNHYDTADALLSDKECRSALDEKLDTMFAKAFQKSDSLRSRYLLEAGADANSTGKNGCPWLISAIDNCLPVLVSDLLQHGADPNTEFDGSTPLFHALASHDDAQRNSNSVEARAAILSKLLEHGARTETKDEQGRTPLHLAVRSGDCETVRILLENGADVRAADGNGLRPIYHTRDPRMIELLRKYEKKKR